MQAKATGDFWKSFDKLPQDIQQRARQAYARWRENPDHPGLHFKCVHPTEPIYSARISRNYRALGLRDNASNSITWFWIGAHDEYERLISM